MSDQLTANFSQKGFTKNFLELMKLQEQLKLCCENSVTEYQYTPINSADPKGNQGDIAYDNNYIYIKTSVGWKRFAISNF